MVEEVESIPRYPSVLSTLKEAIAMIASIVMCTRNVSEMSRLVFNRLVQGLVCKREERDNTGTMDTASGNTWGNGTCLQRTCADVLIDMLRSSVIRSMLENDNDQLPKFIQRSVSALVLMRSRSCPARLRLLTYYSKFEAIFRSLRALCQESQQSQTLLIKASLEGEGLHGKKPTLCSCQIVQHIYPHL